MALIEDYLAFVDTETSGLIPGLHRVIEVATILTDLQLQEIARFDARIEVPDDHIVSDEAAAINGFDRELWRSTSIPFEAYVRFLRCIPYGHVAIPVGHNVGFDRDMLRSHYGKRFFPLSYHQIDTVGLACAMKVAGIFKSENLKLTTITEALGIPHTVKHRAMSDCEAARGIFLRSVAYFKDAVTS